MSRAPSGKVCRDGELLEIVHKGPIMSARESHGRGPGVETKDGGQGTPEVNRSVSIFYESGDCAIDL